MKICPVGFVSKPANYKTQGNRNDVSSNNGASVNFGCDDGFKKFNLCQCSYIIPFLGVKKSASDFELKKIKNLNCPCCGQKMLSKNQYANIYNSLVKTKGQVLQAGLKSAEEYLKPAELEVSKRIIEASIQDPELGLKEIVDRESKKSLPQLEAKQQVIMYKMKKVADSLVKPARGEIKRIVDAGQASILTSSDATHFKRNSFIDKISQVEHSKEDEPIFQEIVELANTMPTTHNDADAFFVKFARYQETEIAKRLLSPSCSTTEHVIPQSKGGQDSTDNYLPMCGDCNSARGNVPYNEWFKTHPEMPENLQKFLDKIQILIDSNQVPKSKIYRSYVDEMIEAVKKTTNGELVLKKPESITFAFHDDDKEPEGDSIEVRRAKLMKKFVYYQNEIARVEKQQEANRASKEYNDICQYLKLLQELEEVKKNKKISSKNINLERRTIQKQEKRLEAPNSQDKRRKTGDAKEKMENAQERLNNWLAQYAQYSRLEGEIKTEIQILLKRIELPSDIQKKIDKVKEKLSKINSFEKNICSSAQGYVKYKDLENALETITDEIDTRKEKNEKEKEDIDFDLPENKTAIRGYRLATKKLQIIQNADMTKFFSSFKKSPISPDFILEDSTRVNRQKIEDLCEKFPIVQWAREEDNIAKLEQQREEISSQMQQLKEQYQYYQAGYEKLNEMKRGLNEDSLKVTLEKLQARKAEVEEMFDMAQNGNNLEFLKHQAHSAYEAYVASFNEED